VGGGLADEVFGVGAVEVDVTAVGVGVFGVEAIEPHDAGEDGVVACFAAPDPAWGAAFEGCVEGRSVTDFFADAKLAGGGLVGAFGEAGAAGGGRYRGLEDESPVSGEFEMLLGDRNFDLVASLRH